MKKIVFIFTLAVVTISGCASGPKTLQDKVIACTEKFTANQSHVIDATNACSHIYGLREARRPRTTLNEVLIDDKTAIR